jgi:hypothetical protein
MSENDPLSLSSEKQLCEALLYWVSENMKPCEQPNHNRVDGQLCLLSKVCHFAIRLGNTSAKSMLVLPHLKLLDF